jgi:polar amino acid transport system substrate-binding protein
MKKLMFLAITVLSIFLLSACRSRVDDVLRVGMDLRYPPFETIDDDEPQGISVDVARAFGEYIGREVEIINTQFGALIPALNSGEIDIIIASMSITEERAQVVDFSEPYFFFKIISLVNQDFADANGITVDTTSDELLELDAQFVGIAAQVSASIPLSYGKDVIEAVDLNSAITEVAQGGADILLMSSFPVTNGHRANRDTTMVVWDPFVSSPIGMAVAQGNTELLQQANEFIATMSEPGGLYDVLSEKWDAEIIALLERYGLEFFINEE